MAKILNRIEEAFTTVYLNKSWRLIPNIVEVIKEYDVNTLKSIVESRNNFYDEMKYNDKIDINKNNNINLKIDRFKENLS